jgi:hypothetical protein
MITLSHPKVAIELETGVVVVVAATVATMAHQGVGLALKVFDV